MNRITKFGLATAFVTIMVTPAFAQDDGTWTGGYIGGRLGHSFQPNDKDETIKFDTNLDGQFADTVRTMAGADAFSPGFCGGGAVGNTPAQGCSEDRDRTEWAVHAGYDIQMGSNFVVGGVVDYGRSNNSDSVTAYSTTPASYTMTRRLKDNASARLRAGVAMGNTLFYGTGGVAYGKIRNSFRTSNTANAFSDTGNEDAWGYRVGGGLEHRISPNFSIGAQYLHTSLKDKDYRVRSARGTAPATNPFILTNANGTDFRRSDDRFNNNSVQVTANFRF